MTARLHGLLDGFAVRINAQPALRGPLAGWSPEFYIQARDSGDTFQVQLHGGRVDGVRPTDAEPGDDALLLRADGGVLEQVFSGDLSPLAAYTDGELEVYGSPKDQIKLDVIALVLWGLESDSSRWFELERRVSPRQASHFHLQGPNESHQSKGPEHQLIL